MKKLVSVLFALLLVGSFAFAQDAAKPAVNVSAWGRLMFVPSAALSGGDVVETEDNLSFAGPTWGDGGRMNTGFAVSASTEHAGFAIDLDVNGGKYMNFGDQAKAWIQPNSMIKIEFGMIQGDALRGKIGDSGYLGAIPALVLQEADETTGDKKVTAAFVQGTTGNDDIFKRFYPKAGMLLNVYPAEGVYIGAALDTNQTDVVTTESMFKNIQIGAGYMIPNVGHARVQYIGSDDLNNTTGAEMDDPAEAKYIQAAFAYTAVEGLLIDAGVKYQFESKAGKSTGAVSATYNKDALSTVGRVAVYFGENGDDDDLGYQVSADVGYVVADPLAIGAEVSYKKEGDPTGLTVVPYAKLNYAGGFLKAGFAYSSFTKQSLDFGNGIVIEDDWTSWSIPIMMQYSF